VQATAGVIPLNRAVPAALVVNELVTNAIKHAFGNDGGTIRVGFALSAESGEACITVEDDGRGMELPPKQGSGLKLVEAFARQIGGRLQYLAAEPGSRTRLCFPVVL